MVFFEMKNRISHVVPFRQTKYSPLERKCRAAECVLLDTVTVQNQERLNKELRSKKLALFIQQFEKDAQERLNELDRKLQNMLATIDKVFEIELLKMPPSLQNTLMGDLIGEQELSGDKAISIDILHESADVHQPFRKASSKRGKFTDPGLVQSSLSRKNSGKTSTRRKGSKRAKLLPGSSSTGNLGTPGSVIKPSDEVMAARRKLRSVVSMGDLHCSGAGSAAHITVTTALGQAVCFSEENKDKINFDLLDDVAWCQVEKLSRDPIRHARDLAPFRSPPVTKREEQDLLSYQRNQGVGPAGPHVSHRTDSTAPAGPPLQPAQQKPDDGSLGRVTRQGLPKFKRLFSATFDLTPAPLQGTHHKGPLKVRPNSNFHLN
ncbi:borealin-2 isoform X2 [Entelurus aequoreus]|uniref:borealin-2 isoform X2 n=1 Tax=Entelurus aequoreus TaxID=161455 RepID=UPI002B1D2204|nr:borealin-2 isoform X2 [Entelurus aequoreus]